MDKMILEGVLQKFDNKHNGRIYPKDIFDREVTKIYKKSVRKLIRKKKINNILNDEAREI
jgi:hypothetical protein